MPRKNKDAVAVTTEKPVEKKPAAAAKKVKAAVAATKTTRRKSRISAFMIQAGGEEVSYEAIVDRVRTEFPDAGKIAVYVNADERMIYAVVDDDKTMTMNLFF